MVAQTEKTLSDTASATAANELPKQKVKKGVFEFFRNLREINKREGGLVPFAGAATVLGVSKQRVHDLVNEGTLRVIEFSGKKWLSANELESFVKVQRQAGRPWKEPSIKDQWRAAMEGVKEKSPPDAK